MAANRYNLGLGLGLGSDVLKYSSTAAPPSSSSTAMAALYPRPSPSPNHKQSNNNKDSLNLSRYYSSSFPDVGLASSTRQQHDTDLHSILPGFKRSYQALYHPNLLGTQSAIEQTEGWFSTELLSKRAKSESASNMSVLPQRPGEKDCAHYMLTRTCKFGPTCKFDHPIWVPEGGIPDWKEVPVVTVESLPERPEEPDCPYFLKTQRCRFGSRCKFNHPKDKLTVAGGPDSADVSVLPERPSEPPCAFYMKTGNCKFGATCKFHHPKDIKVPQTTQEDVDSAQEDSVDVFPGDGNFVKPHTSISSAIMHNSKGLPIRPGEVDCPFYLKTGSCKYGGTCRYNHPDWSVINPIAAVASNSSMVASSAAYRSVVVDPSASILQTFDPRMTQAMLGMGTAIYPQRPGQIECDFYMKTGECKFGERCKYHHPIDRSAPSHKMVNQTQQSIKLTPAGLPRREGAVHCPYYLKTATCKFGATCKFDHPPPGEVMTKATTEEASASVGKEG